MISMRSVLSSVGWWALIAALLVVALIGFLSITRGTVVRHVRGVNVLYASGMAQWVDLKAFERKNDPSPLPNPWNKIPPGIGTDVNSTDTKYNDALLNEASNPPTGVWIDLDGQSR